MVVEDIELAKMEKVLVDIGYVDVWKQPWLCLKLNSKRLTFFFGWQNTISFLKQQKQRHPSSIALKQQEEGSAYYLEEKIFKKKKKLNFIFNGKLGTVKIETNINAFEMLFQFFMY